LEGFNSRFKITGDNVTAIMTDGLALRNIILLGPFVGQRLIMLNSMDNISNWHYPSPFALYR